MIFGDVYLINVKDCIPHRNTKHCICVATELNRFLLINTDHREMYDDFEISSNDYSFLKGEDRYISCSKTFQFDDTRIIKKVGKLLQKDLIKIKNKVEKSGRLNKLEKDKILNEFNKQNLSDY